MTNTDVDVSVREVDQCCVLDVKAENFTYPQTGIIKNIISHLLQQQKRFFVLNMTDVQLVDSYGLATILASLKLIQEQHGAMAMYGLNDFFSRLVTVTRLNQVLEIWPNESQAIHYITTNNKAASH